MSGAGDLSWYTITVDTTTFFTGHRSLHLAARSSSARYGGVIQRFRAEQFRGHHLQITGHFRVRNAPGAAALWVRVESDVTQFAFRRVGIPGAVAPRSSWHRDSVVVAVSPRAVGVTIGAFLVGTGDAWLDDFSVRIVPDSVPLSPRHRRIQPLGADSLAALYGDAPAAPVDLGFETGGVR